MKRFVRGSAGLLPCAGLAVEPRRGLAHPPSSARKSFGWPSVERLSLERPHSANGRGSLGMLLGLCPVGAAGPSHTCRAGTLFSGRATTPTATCSVGSCRFPMLRRCTPVWSWLSRYSLRALLYLKTSPGSATAAAKIAIGVAATGLALPPAGHRRAVRVRRLQGESGLVAQLSGAAVGGRAAGRRSARRSRLRLAPPTRGGRWPVPGISTALGHWLAGRPGGLWGASATAYFSLG